MVHGTNNRLKHFLKKLFTTDETKVDKTHCKNKCFLAENNGSIISMNSIIPNIKTVYAYVHLQHKNSHLQS